MYYVRYNVKGEVTIGVGEDKDYSETEAAVEATKIFEHFIRHELSDATLGNLQYDLADIWYREEDDDDD